MGHRGQPHRNQPRSYNIFVKIFIIISWFAQGISKKNSGMGYRPHPPDAKIESTLIWYRWDPQLENQEKKRREENVIRIFLQPVFSGTGRPTATGMGQSRTSGGTAGSKMISKWVYIFWLWLSLSHIRLWSFFVVGVSVDGDVFNVLVDGFVIRCLKISSEPERARFFQWERYQPD